MKEVLMTYDKFKKEFENMEIGTHNFLKAKYFHLQGMLLLLREANLISKEEFAKEHLDLIDIREEKGIRL